MDPLVPVGCQVILAQLDRREQLDPLAHLVLPDWLALLDRQVCLVQLVYQEPVATQGLLDLRVLMAELGLLVYLEMMEGLEVLVFLVAPDTQVIQGLRVL